MSNHENSLNLPILRQLALKRNYNKFFFFFNFISFLIF